MENKNLSNESLQALREIVRTDEWHLLGRQVLNAWVNRCNDRIVSIKDVDGSIPSQERLLEYALGIRYGTQALQFFFTTFLGSITVDPEGEKKYTKKGN